MNEQPHTIVEKVDWISDCHLAPVEQIVTNVENEDGGNWMACTFLCQDCNKECHPYTDPKAHTGTVE